MPDASAVKKLYEKEKENGLHPAFPYWAKLWPSGLGLAHFVLQHPQYTTGKRVLEIAAGLGLPSLVAATTAHHVLCTDMAEEAMQVASQSAALAGLQNMHCQPMNWNEIDESIAAETLLLSDVNYEPEVFETLLQVIHVFLKNGTTILLATPQRLMAKPFVEKLKPNCQQQETLEVRDDTGVHPISVYVLQLQK